MSYTYSFLLPLILQFTLKIREPLIKHTQYSVLTVHEFTKFPAFDREIPLPDKPKDLNQSNPQSQEVKPEPKPEPKKSAQVSEPKQSIVQPKQEAEPVSKYPATVMLVPANDPLKDLQEMEVPAGLTLEQVLTPDDPDKIFCVGFLKKLAEDLEKAIS